MEIIRNGLRRSAVGKQNARRQRRRVESFKMMKRYLEGFFIMRKGCAAHVRRYHHGRTRNAVPVP